MGLEEQYTGYYTSILQGKSHIDTTLSIQTAVSDFLAQVFFGKDFSRIIYTNPEYAFRKRLERLGNGFQEEDLDLSNNRVFLSNIQLPFCSFYLSGAPEIIKTAAASEWVGYYDNDIDQVMHFIHTIQKCTVQFWFNRIDDATVAFELAQNESLAEYPIRYVQEIYWRNKSIPYPIFITVKDVKAGNESFNESDWLERNHMFAMTMELEIELPRIHINRGLNAVQLPFKWHATGNIDTWKPETGFTDYYVQKCVLLWANKSLGIDITSPKETTDAVKDLANNPMLKISSLVDCDENTLRQIQSVVPNHATAEMVEGYFKNATQITFNRLKYVPEKTTISDKGEVTAWIDTVVKPSTYDWWDYTEIYIPSRQKGESIRMKDCHAKNVLIDGLHPNSTYTIYFIAHDTAGNFNTIPLTFTTPVWEKETLPDVTSPDDRSNPLITTIQAAKEKPKPTIIKGRGLIGLEL